MARNNRGFSGGPADEADLEFRNLGQSGQPVFGGPQGDDLGASEEDPGYGADPMFAPPQDTLPPPPEDRSGLLPLGADADGISDDDLLTPEELAENLPDILALMGVEPPYDHDENLAEVLDEAYLDRLGQECIDQVTADLESRQPWVERFRRGLEIMGLKDYVWDAGKAPFEGASTAVAPVLSEAVIQSQARLMEEVWPAQGPAKTDIMGIETPQKRDAADRVANHMNYQLTIEDPTYTMECEKLGLYLPIYGTGYRKGYHDFVTDQNVLRFVPAEDMILPYSARNLASSSRRTHRFPCSENDFRRAVAAGQYRDVDLYDPGEEDPDEIEQQRDKVDSKAPSTDENDVDYTFYEMDCYLDIPGYEDTKDGTPTGVALPYTVTFEKDSGKVLAIRRCWDEADDLKLMTVRYAEYWYLPGIGAYGFGLIHFIGTLAESSTDALRSLMDSATWANLQGGFKAKDATVKAGEMHLRPGTWIDVDMSAEELKNAFHTPPFKEPSEALFKVLDLLVKMSQRFASTTDMMVGDQEAKGAPVGTTVALIEQGSKVYSGIHKRAHFACGVELRMLFKLNAKYIPAEGYPYLVPGEDRAVYQSDYDTSMVSVVPVSDPNIYSQTQRIALAQSEYQLAKENPAYFNQGALLKKMLKAFKEPDIDEIFIDPDNVPLMDPVSENIAMVTGRPVKAKDGENHQLHLITHMAFAQHPQFGGLPQAQQMFGAAMMAHIAEHVALLYADTMRGMGVHVPPVNLAVPAGKSIVGDENPETALQVAQMAAAMTQQFLQSAGLTTTPPGQGGGDQEAEDNHHESLIRQFTGMATGLGTLLKVGQSLQAGMQAEAMVLGADGQPVPAGPAAPGQPPAPQPPVGGALDGANKAGGNPPNLRVVPPGPALAG